MPTGNTPQQDMQGVQATIVRRLDEVATRQPSDSMGLLHFSTSGGGALEGGMLVLLPRQGSEHRDMYARNKICSSKCRGTIWHLCVCPDV